MVAGAEGMQDRQPCRVLVEVKQPELLPVTQALAADLV